MFSGVSEWIIGLKRVNFNLWFSDVFRWVSKQNFILVVALQPRDGRSLSINRGHIKFFLLFLIFKTLFQLDNSVQKNVLF